MIFLLWITTRNQPVHHSHFTVKDTETYTYKCVAEDQLRKPKVNVIQQFRFWGSDIDLFLFILLANYPEYSRHLIVFEINFF